MRVAVIPTIRHFPWGAPGHFMGELVSTLAQAGHEMLWLVAPIDLDHSRVKQMRRAGVNVVSLPESPPRYVHLADVRHWIRRRGQSTPPLDEIIGAFNPEHVFMNQGGTWCSTQEDFWRCLEPRMGSYSLICHSNQPQPAFDPALFERARRLMAGSSKVYFGSTWTQHLAELQIAASIAQATRFQCPVRFNFRYPLPWPKSPCPRLAIVSRLDAFTKGMDIVIEALARLRREGQQFHLTIYGSGTDENYLRRLASFFEIESIISFAGHREDLQNVWLEEELLLLPSRFEGLAMSMIEAMGFGRPVLRTACGGSEWIEDGINGYICPAAEVELIQETLRRAFTQRSRWPEMGRRAHEKIRCDLNPNPATVFLKSLES